MPADLGSLHRILKDPTRRRILSALNEKGPLAYVEILGLLEIEHTGKLNYHLKLLGDLISKDDSGRYTLTEKGKLAVQVTSKFQRVSSQENQSTLHVGKIGLGKLLLVLSIPLFILSFIPSLGTTGWRLACLFSSGLLPSCFWSSAWFSFSQGVNQMTICHFCKR